jgi:hypothetical protein
MRVFQPRREPAKQFAATPFQRGEVGLQLGDLVLAL